MREGDAIIVAGNGHRDTREFGRDRLGIDALLHHRDAQRHVDLARPAGRPGDDAAFDADLHGHDAGAHVAFARGADDGSLVAQAEYTGFGALGVIPNQELHRYSHCEVRRLNV